MGGEGQTPFYKGVGYNKQFVGTTELKWGSYLADILFDTSNSKAVVSSELRLTGKVKPQSFANFMLNFDEFFDFTSDFIREGDLVERVDKMFEDADLRLDARLTKKKVIAVLKLYKKYKSAFYHTKALLQIITETTSFMEQRPEK